MRRRPSRTHAGGLGGTIHRSSCWPGLFRVQPNPTTGGRLCIMCAFDAEAIWSWCYERRKRPTAIGANTATSPIDHSTAGIT